MVTKSPSNHGETIVRSTCQQCLYLCGALLHIQNGRVVKIERDPEHPQLDGLCPRGASYLNILNSPDRLKHPLMKDGGGWKKVSWEQALDDIARKLKEIKERYTPLAISVAADGGPRQVWNTLLARALGSPNVILNTVVCSASLQIGEMATFGAWICGDVGPDCENSRCVMLAGTNPYAHCPPLWMRIKKAISKGAKLIVIDPRYTESAQRADLWLRIRPGTDAVLALGMAKIIIDEGIYDKEFVQNWCVGFEALRDRVAEYPLDKVSAITGVEREEIVQAARMFATLRPASFHCRTGLAHSTNGVQTVRAYAVMVALAGNLDIPGGNLFTAEIKRKGGIIDQQDLHSLKEWRLPKEIEDQTIGAHTYPLYAGPNSFIVAAHNSQLMKAILHGKPYPVKAMIVMGSNLVITHPNSHEVWEALKSLELLVVCELFMTPTAELAQYVLPVASFYERDEVCDRFYPNYVAIRQKGVEPPAECWEDRKIIFELARRLKENGALEHPKFLPWKTVEEFNDFRLARAGLTFSDLKQKGIVAFPMEYRKYEKKGFKTPSGKVELYASIFEKLGYDPLPHYEEPQESKVRTPELAKQYPLILITGVRHLTYKGSEMRHSPWLRKVHPHPIAQIHPDIARMRGIQDGDWVWIETRNGKIKQRAKLSDKIHPEAVYIQDGWWFPEKAGPEHGCWDANANVLTFTDDKYHDPISGAQYLKCLLCEVRKAAEAP